MLWIILAILASLCWAVVSTVDKYILTKWIRKPIIPVITLGIIGLITTLIVYIIHGFSYLSYLNIFLCFIAGIFYILMAVFYFMALKIEEVSRIIPMFYLFPLFVLLLATIFLGEIFTPLKYLGIFLLVIGAILVSSKDFRKISLGKAFWLMVLATISIAISHVLMKYVLNFADYWTVFSYIRIGAAFALIPIVYFYLPEFLTTIKRYGKKVIGLMSINETFSLTGTILITIATAIGYVTLVSALSSLQSFFVLLIAVFLSIFYPRILKEEIEKSTVALKIMAITIMFIGVMLVI